jgi:hypothetical protein
MVKTIGQQRAHGGGVAVAQLAARPGGQDGQQPVCDLPELVFGNGMERAGECVFAVDSARGLVFSIDPSQRSSWIWM